VIRMLVFLLAFLLTVAQPANACELPDTVSSLRQELLSLTNETRVAAGLVALARDPRLEEAAQSQACRTAQRERLSHRGSWLAGLGRRLRRVAYRYAMAAENLAEGQRSATEVHAGWLSSPGHRVNTLDPRAREAGFGVAVAENGRLHWAMIVAAPRQD